MKQKRKVKSLISQKMEWSESLLTTLLLILSVILCIGSASLMTTSVGAADDDQHFEFAYTGLDNKSEVLYRMNFIDPNNLSNVRNTMYMSGKTLYIAPYPVMVNPKNPETNEISTARNEIIGTEKSNILGGDNNKINYSDNITIIAGDGNIIRSGYSNSVVIGGKDNSLNSGVYNNYKQMNSVFIGGDNNRANNDGNATLIGGNNNKIYSNNSFILGGSDNQIDNPNSIVGGKNVKLELYSNRFAFSYRGSDNFIPEGSNAFYLNLENGVGLGVDGSRGGLAVSGAVYFGEIDIRTIRCNTGANIGLKGSYSGCLVGCTKGGFDDGGKWEMLDRGEKCTEICNDNSSYCTNKTEELVPVDDYVAFCTTGVVNTSNAELCYSGEIENYKNVVFETSLIDSNENCIDFGTGNKCLYKCKEGFHLTGDIAGGGHGTKTGCYQDCKLPWNEDKTIKHNEKITGYKQSIAYCAYDSGNPQSIDTCNNYKKTLVCSGGTLFLAKPGNENLASNTTAVSGGYVLEHCELFDYRCNTFEYVLNAEDVSLGEEREGYTDNVLSHWNQIDRSTALGQRGTYKVCKDFDADPTNPTQDGTNCTEQIRHYKLVSCKNGYATGSNYPNECRRTCISPVDGTVMKDGEKIGGYINGNFVCPHSCDDEIILICHDGQWKDENGNTVNTVSSTCSVSDEVCEGYNVDYTTYEIYNNESGENPTSIYEPCTKYRSSPDHQHCTEGETVYKLVDCVDGYHMEEGYNHCIPDERAGLCSSYVSIPKHHAHRKYAGGIFNREWNGNSRVMNPEDACDWECDDPYEKETTDKEGGYVCVSKPECGLNPNECKGDNPTSTGQNNDGKGNYYWTCIGNYEGDNIGYANNNGEGGETYTYGGEGLEIPCHACASSYTWDGLNNRCIKKENGTCEPDHYNCKSMDGYPIGIVDNRSNNDDDKYTWECKANYATGATAYCQECRYNLTGDDCHPLTQQVDCPSDKPDNSYWRIGTDGGTYTQTWTKGTTRDYWSHGYWSPNYLTNHVSQYASSYNECSFTCIWYDGYEYNSSTKKCVKCTGLPDNATPNNNKLPDDVTEYYFSNDTSAPCTFKCDTYYTWDNEEERCEPNEYACTNKPTGSGYKFGSGTYSYGDTLTEWTYTDNSTPGTCQFTCDTSNGYTWDGSGCVLGTYTCGGTKPTGTKYTLGTATYTYGYTPNTWTRVNDTATVGACQYKCNTSAGYGWNGSDCVLIACGGTKPTGNGYIFTLKNPVNVADMKNWTHMTDGTSQSSLNACEYTCDLNSSYYYNGSICKYNNSWCNNDNVNGCQSPATSKNENSSDPTKDTWDCAINGVIMEAGCFKCKEGYTLHNGACVKKYTVSFSSAYGSMSSQEFIGGVSQNLKQNEFVRPGYSFRGWTSRSSSRDSETASVDYTDKQSITVNGNTTLYALWEKGQCIPTKTCSDYGYYSSTFGSECFKEIYIDDVCGNCYQAGCSNIMGDSSYKCYGSFTDIPYYVQNGSLPVIHGYCAKNAELGERYRKDTAQTCDYNHPGNSSYNGSNCVGGINLTLYGQFYYDHRCGYSKRDQTCCSVNNRVVKCSFFTKSQIIDGGGTFTN